MLPSFCTQTITRLRAGVKDSRGSLIPDWNNVNELLITDCSVQPVGGSISTDGRVLGVTDTYSVYMNPGTDVHAGDRIVYNGKTYDINEEPGIWQSPTGRVSSLQCSMTLHKG